MSKKPFVNSLIKFCIHGYHLKISRDRFPKSVVHWRPRYDNADRMQRFAESVYSTTKRETAQTLLPVSDMKYIPAGNSDTSMRLSAAMNDVISRPAASKMLI
ncbi:hypothetical protein SDC9_49913 [bioreactor metagenome]|uniref:Uncharacterized protein n=1 Tax=bioreactor metagenome TaxID=1076179 RepID=A0A644WIF5_9ZZZZ